MAIRRHAQRKHFHFYSRCSTWTFVQNVAAKPISWRAEHWVLGGVALILTALVGIVIPGWANATRHDPAPAAYTTLALEVPQLAARRRSRSVDRRLRPRRRRRTRLASRHACAPASRSPTSSMRTVLSPADLQRALNSQDDASALRHIHPGDEFAFVHGRERRADADALRPRRCGARHAALHAGRRHRSRRRARDRAPHAGRARRAHALAVRSGRVRPA